MNGLQSLWDFIVPSAYADADSIQSKGVAYNESRGMTRKMMNTEGKAGELGKYQLTPMAWGELENRVPGYKGKDRYQTLTNDQQAEIALRDYLNILEHHYAKHYKIEPTDENLLQMYNLGPRKFHRGYINPAYVESYKRGIGQ